MPAPARTHYIMPDGENAVLAVGVGDSFGGTVLEAGSRRDISSDSLAVSAKLDTSAKTLTIAAVSPQTGTGKGRFIVTVPAAELSAEGTLYVDVKIQLSGEEAKIIKRWTFTVEDSDAD